MDTDGHVDFRMTDYGSVVGFEPLTESAKYFVKEHLRPEPWQWVGQMFHVDHRPARTLRENLEEEGFIFE